MVDDNARCPLCNCQVKNFDSNYVEHLKTHKSEAFYTSSEFTVCPWCFGYFSYEELCEGDHFDICPNRENGVEVPQYMREIMLESLNHRPIDFTDAVMDNSETNAGPSLDDTLIFHPEDVPGPSATDSDDESDGGSCSSSDDYSPSGSEFSEDNDWKGDDWYDSDEIDQPGGSGGEELEENQEENPEINFVFDDLEKDIAQNEKDKESDKPIQDKPTAEREGKYRKVLDNFAWSGPPPNLDLNHRQIEIMHALFDRKCTICMESEKKIRSLNLIKTISRDASEAMEQTMLAHLLLYHTEDKDILHLLEIKKYKLSTAPGDSRPLLFLLEKKGARLICSCCTKATFSRPHSLVIHFAECFRGKNLGMKPRVSKQCPTHSVASCPVNCGLKWKVGNHYSVEVSQVHHLLRKHTLEKEAYEKGLKTAEEKNLAGNIPFWDVKKSWAKTVMRSEKQGEVSVLACSKCEYEYATNDLKVLYKHAMRNHSSNLCPYGCSVRPLQMYTIAESGVFYPIMHVLRNHFPEEKAVQWLRIRSEEVALAEFPFFDIKESIELSLSLQVPRILCRCGETIIPTFYLHHLSKSCSNIRIKRNVIGIARKLKRNKVVPKNENYRRTYDKCFICNHSMAVTTRYTPMIGIFFHALKAHKRIIDNYLNEWDIEKARTEFPYIDLQKSIDGSKKYNLSSEDYVVSCAKCDERTVVPSGPKSLLKVLKHAEVHRVASSIGLSYKCPACLCQMKKSRYDLRVTMLCHYVRMHPEQSSDFEKLWDSDWEQDEFPFMSIKDSFESESLRCSMCAYSGNNITNLSAHVTKHHLETVLQRRGKAVDSMIAVNTEKQKASEKSGKLEKSTAKTAKENPSERPKPSSSESVMSESNPQQDTKQKPKPTPSDDAGEFQRSREVSVDRMSTTSDMSTASDRNKWKDTFKRYGHLERDLKRQRLEASRNKTASTSKQTRLSGYFLRTSTDMTPIPMKRRSREAKND